MKLKRALISAVAALSMAVSVMAPVAMADTTSTSGTTEVTDDGDFSISSTVSGWSFGTTNVSTFDDGGTLSTDEDEVKVFVHDTRSSSPGWALTLEASNFTSDDGTHIIRVGNLTLTRSWLYNGDFQASCLDPSPDGNDPAPNPDNAFQTLTASGDGTVLGNGDVPVPVQILSATSGRGCGHPVNYLSFALTIPAGTYTGGGTATYTSNITITDAQAPTGT